MRVHARERKGERKIDGEGSERERGSEKERERVNDASEKQTAAHPGQIQKRQKATAREEMFRGFQHQWVVSHDVLYSTAACVWLAALEASSRCLGQQGDILSFVFKMFDGTSP